MYCVFILIKRSGSNKNTVDYSPIDSVCLVSHNVWPELCVGAHAEASTQCHYSTAG